MSVKQEAEGASGDEAKRFRSLQFWSRAGSIWAGYKLAQAQAQWLRVRGHSEEHIKETHWAPHADRAGQDMHALCVDMRGFFIKAGQFLGARSDFIPEETCAWLRKLSDEVPPMPPRQVSTLLKRELHVADLGAVFEWIDLEKPLGSASIAQVHKARLRQYARRPPLLRRAVTWPGRALMRVIGRGGPKALDTRPSTAVSHCVAAGEDAWAIANTHGVSLNQLSAANKRNADVSLDALREGQIVWLPKACSVVEHGSDEERGRAVTEAVRRSNLSQDGPAGGVVAVKVQYPDALPLFTKDLGNIRRLAGLLSRTELAFDLVSAVDELSAQVKFEFNFEREARVMDTVAENLRAIRNRVVIPRSVPGLVTRRVLVMEYLDGVPLTQLGSRVSNLSAVQKKMAMTRVVTRASEAYGRMILETGLFQADGHPGNIMVLPGGVVGLIDYGQSKQLSQRDRLTVARLVLALTSGDDAAVSVALANMGIATERDDVALRAEMGRGMFDTSGKVDPFDENSPIKQCAITDFPKQFFLVLRVVQLFRGLATRMGVDFSSAEQWRPYAAAALRAAGEAEEVVPPRPPPPLREGGHAVQGTSLGEEMGALVREARDEM